MAPRIKAAMREAIEASGLSRPAIADRMNAVALRDGIGKGGRGRKISKDVIDAWCSESKNHLPDTELLVIFCSVTGSEEPLRAAAAPLGCQIVNRTDARLLEWAKAEFKSRELAKRKKRLLAQIEEEI